MCIVCTDAAHVWVLPCSACANCAMGRVCELWFVACVCIVLCSMCASFRIGFGVGCAGRCESTPVARTRARKPCMVKDKRTALGVHCAGLWCCCSRLQLQVCGDAEHYSSGAFGFFDLVVACPPYGATEVYGSQGGVPCCCYVLLHRIVHALLDGDLSHIASNSQVSFEDKFKKCVQVAGCLHGCLLWRLAHLTFPRRLRQKAWHQTDLLFSW